MRRFAPALCGFVLLLTGLTGSAAGRFDQKLTGDKQIVHVLNRLTFGPRPGDIAEVRRLGVEKWIDLQLHPDKIPQNAELLARLKPLETLQLAMWQINEKYAPPQRPLPQLQALLNQVQITKLQGGSVEERREVFASLAPNVRNQVLAIVPPQALEGLPGLQQEAEQARRMAGVVRRPDAVPLPPEQMRMLRGGTLEQKMEILSKLDGDARTQALRAAGPQAFNGMPQLRREAMAANQPQQYVNQELIEHKLYRAIYSSRQLEEVLVDFWMNHFNVFNGKNQTRVLLTSYERDAIRPNVLGRFKDLLSATAHHPAMLIYLDNVQSQVPREDVRPQPGPNGAPARQPGINENYGRELMELHTLGVDGGYTQEDVVAVARAFTGWTVFDPQKYAEFQFNPGGHDRKEKVVLGQTLPPGRGQQDGLDVIDILSRHPSTAKFISRKLAQRFVADDPPQALIDRMAATFTKTGGDLRAVLQTLFSSVEFSSEGAWQAKMKSPLELVVSAVRAVNADAVDAFPLGQRIAEIGQPLYAKAEPTGYPNTGESWGSASGILGRINFAIALTSNQVPGVKADVSRFNFKAPAGVAGELLGLPPSPETLAAIQSSFDGKEATPSLLTASILGSPEFQKR
jgi:uncharacterized protein (DUF1800 family)